MQTGKGRISCITTKDFQGFSDSAVALEKDFHLSYPCVFEHEGEFFMTPEQQESGEIALYRATNFPLKWEKAGTLVPEFEGLDPTVFFHDGKWWLFTSKEDENENFNLHIYYSDELTGDWKAHPGNPFIAKENVLRPAGRPFMHNGILMRPSQNCTETYGGSINISRITALSETTFKEKLFAELRPSDPWKYWNGMHTVDFGAEFTIIDGKRRLKEKGSPGKAVGAVLRRTLQSIFRR